MKIRTLMILLVGLLLLASDQDFAVAKEYTQMNGLFSMDIPETWHWAEDSDKVVISYPDGETVAIDIEMMPSINMSQAMIKKTLHDNIDKMIKEGVEAHHGVLIDNKEVKLNGVYARQLDFKTASPNSLNITYISLFNNRYAFTITYGGNDEKMNLEIDDIIATLRFK